MPDKEIDLTNLEDARKTIKHLKQELEMVKEQLDKLQGKNEELERLAITDDLTGLYNQRYFFRTLNEEVARNKRQGHSLCLIFLDVDNLKSFNDAWGHSAGNEVLRLVAKSISLHIRRDVDSGFRYGGDEFAVILPEVQSPRAVDIALRIGSLFLKPDTKNVNLSMGIAELKPDMDSKTLLANADKAMYMAKNGQGNVDIDGNIFKICVL